MRPSGSLCQRQGRTVARKRKADFTAAAARSSAQRRTNTHYYVGQDGLIQLFGRTLPGVFNAYNKVPSERPVLFSSRRQFQF